jgi:hypothetical protein
MSYQPYPTSGADQMPQQQRPPAPPSIQTAVKLMYVGAGISALSFIIGLATIGSLKQAIINASSKPLTASQLHAAQVFGVATIVILGLIGIGLWLWMARANGAGKSWARIVAAVLFGLNTLGLLSGVARPNAVGTKIFDILIWIVGLGATVFLWRRDSSEYFAQSSRKF